MKTVLGLDIGSNSIGHALIEYDFEGHTGRILSIGSRIVPMDADLLLNFEQGNSISRTAARRQARGARRLRNRYKLRRQRLTMVLKALGWLPSDFEPGHQLPLRPERLSEMQAYFGTTQISADWVVYFLREKALTERIELDELARVIFHMNQRRGFKSNRKATNDETAIETSDDEQDGDNAPKREKRVAIVKIAAVRDTGEMNKRKKLIELCLDAEVLTGLSTGIILRDSVPDWVGKDMELEIRIIRTKAETKLEFSLPDKTKWQELKEALNRNIEEEGLYPGQYFLHKLHDDHTYRIREQIIDRKRYEDELRTIWETQAKHHTELSSREQIPELAMALYKHNQEKHRELNANDLLYLIACDIIYYQRPLKSQKDSIGFDFREPKNATFTIKKNGKDVTVTPYHRVAPQSSPLFQEFRIWKTIHQLQVLKGKELVDGAWKTDVDVSEQFLKTEAKEKLFRLFDSKEQVKASEILKTLFPQKNEDYKLNYESDTVFKAAETKQAFRKAFKRAGFTEGEALLSNPDTLERLWHLVYSVEDEAAILKAAQKAGLPEAAAKAVSRMKPFDLKYAAYSSKGLNKMLGLMRVGSFWSADGIHPDALQRIHKLIDGEWEPELSEDMRQRIEKFRLKYKLETLEGHQGLPEWLASCLIYGRHSERPAGAVCHTPGEIQTVTQTSLRNPIVEQIVNETLQIVKDIWTRENYWDLPAGQRPEIRVELARDLKKTAAERERINDANKKNREDKDRIRAILRELRYGNPDSLSDVEKVRLLEENGNYKGRNILEKFFKKATEPTAAEVERYRLWVEQSCISPYTGKAIMLSKLFDRREYDVDHIFPQSRYYDDSMANKVIVEAWANAEKGALTAMQYIQRRTMKAGKTLLSPEEFIAHVERTFFGKKRKNLLAAEIPTGFIQRQLNDTRHISRRVNELLYQFTSPDNVHASSGMITDELKHQWGLGNAMKKSLLPRFERLEKILGEPLVEYRKNEDGQQHLILKGYEKRIDHRHHAIDALVVACTQQAHVQYINTLEAQQGNGEMKAGFKRLLKGDKTREFKLPWKTFIPDAGKAVDGIIVSHKNRHRTLVKGVNRYKKFVPDGKGGWIKSEVEQEKGPLLSVRKPLHKETIAGTVQFREYRKASIDEALKNPSVIADAKVKRLLSALIDEFGGNTKKIKEAIKVRALTDKDSKPIDKVTVWFMEPYALNRVALNDTFTKDKIEKIAEYDTEKERGLKDLLFKHLEAKGGDPKAAFIGEGLEELAKKAGRPVSKVSIYEPIGAKFEIRPGQLVEAAKGTNLFFVIYTNAESGARKYRTLGLNEVIGAKSQSLSIVPPEDGYTHFLLSPNDLVYVPEEGENVRNIDWLDTAALSSKIYKMVSCTKKECHFIPHSLARPLVDTKELGANNKSERAWDGQMIKQVCVKLKHNRLGIEPAQTIA